MAQCSHADGEEIGSGEAKIQIVPTSKHKFSKSLSLLLSTINRCFVR